MIKAGDIFEFYHRDRYFTDDEWIYGGKYIVVNVDIDGTNINHITIVFDNNKAVRSFRNDSSELFWYEGYNVFKAIMCSK